MDADAVLSFVESFLEEWNEAEGENFQFDIVDKVTSFTIIPQV